MNQRKDFAELLRLLACGNPGRRFSYFGELRGEGITAATAKLLREANFTEVEVGLQSIDPEAQKRMDRENNCGPSSAASGPCSMKASASRST